MTKDSNSKNVFWSNWRSSNRCHAMTVQFPKKNSCGTAKRPLFYDEDAHTVHKMQATTINAASKLFALGRPYVVLSQERSLNGLWKTHK
jgi:hypothetical protein